jgi:hypothetical protein
LTFRLRDALRILYPPDPQPAPIIAAVADRVASAEDY